MLSLKVMYIIKSTPPELNDPIERIEKVLLQIQTYLDYNKQYSTSSEYKDISVLFAALLNLLTENNYKNICDNLIQTRRKVTSTKQYADKFWREYLLFMHWKLTT